MTLRITQWLMIVSIVLAAALGCHGVGKTTHEKRITQDEALALAVQLANERCMKRFAVAPFDRSTYSIVFREGRWYWGELNVRGVDGYSAIVSFDETGSARKVEVFLSTDELTPEE